MNECVVRALCVCVCVCEYCLRWYRVALGLTLDDDIISGVDNVVLH